MTVLTIRVYSINRTTRVRRELLARTTSKGTQFPEPLSFPPCECPLHRVCQQEQR